ncbi:hypothetical protein ABB02_01816 [Clostridiaceae bacterium JG1575]|nr:hypothetical protein ABB02_01816 [Clostridiaceae bacterium JG1575]
MDLVFGALLLSGPFRLVNIKELGRDRDFFLALPSEILNVSFGAERVQFVGIVRLLVRASLVSEEVTFHLLSDQDLGSSFANFTWSARLDAFVLEEHEHQWTLCKKQKEQKESETEGFGSQKGFMKGQGAPPPTGDPRDQGSLL